MTIQSTASKEDLRALVIKLCHALDEIEYERKALYSTPELQAAMLAAIRIDLRSGMGIIADVFEDAYEHLDQYKDIDLSRPEYSGMDDPL